MISAHRAAPCWPGKDKPQLRLPEAACDNSNDTAHHPSPGSHLLLPELGHQGHTAGSARARSPHRRDCKASPSR